MVILSINQLTDAQALSIHELEKICRENDGLENRLFLSNEMSFDKDIPTFFMAYEGTELLGFLTIFIPTKEEAEVSAIVHPAYRRKGIFTKLEGTAENVVFENGIGRIIYSVEAKCESAHHVLKSWNVTDILRSEYRMEIDKDRVNRDAPRIDAVYSAKRLTPENASAYALISDRVYGDEGADRLNSLMTSQDRMGYVFYKNEEPVGIFAIGLEIKDQPFIYGVAIAEQHRGKGYGRPLMQEACKLGGRYGKLLKLDVDSENPVAFRLYRNIGFEISFQVDYYAGRTIAN